MTITVEPPVRAAVPEQQAPKAGPWVGFAVVLAAMILNILDSTILNVAAPSIQRDLTLSPSALEWIAAAYTLALAVGLLAGGRLGDAYGRKPMLMVGLVGFVAASVACSVAWSAETLVNAYSVGKPIVALAVLQLVAAGRIELDEPASRRWPELVAGRHGATVRHALSHRAGVPAIRAPLTNASLWDWDAMCRALAASEPWWTPGTAHAYHANTYGHLVGELARRVDGRPPAYRWLELGADGGIETGIEWVDEHA